MPAVSSSLITTVFLIVLALQIQTAALLHSKSNVQNALINCTISVKLINKSLKFHSGNTLRKLLYIPVQICQVLFMEELISEKTKEQQTSSINVMSTNSQDGRLNVNHHVISKLYYGMVGVIRGAVHGRFNLLFTSA